MFEALILKTTEFFRGDAKRIQHFMKVYAYSSLIGRMEGISEQTQRILEAAAIVHDTGIKKAEEIYGYNNGKLQEEFGVESASMLLSDSGLAKEEQERAVWLVGHHHTYTDMEGIDYRILVEADFLVNMYEDNMPLENIRKTYEKIFFTKSGKKLCREIFGL